MVGFLGMGQSVRQEKVWKDCERAGEQQVMLNLTPGGIWSQAQSEWHQHAKNWLLTQGWKRASATEAAANRASQAAWFSALAALASTLLALISILIGR
jgi:hypothetical protein